MVRLCALMSLRSRLIHDVTLGPANTGEVTYAKQLKVVPQSLTLFDRCYLPAELLINWQQKQDDAHWLVPVKGNTKYRILETFSAGDHRVEMQVSAHARKQGASLPETWEARLIESGDGSGSLKGFITSLTDPIEEDVKQFVLPDKRKRPKKGPFVSQKPRIPFTQSILSERC